MPVVANQRLKQLLWMLIGDGHIKLMTMQIVTAELLGIQMYALMVSVVPKTVHLMELTKPLSQVHMESHQLVQSLS